MADYEVSGAWVDSVLRALKQGPHFEALRESLGAAALALVDAPWSTPWHPALHFEAVGEMAAELLGEDAFAALSAAALRERFGPIVLPLLERPLARAQRSPAALLSRLESVVTVAMKGVRFHWQPEGETGGVLQVRYPRAVAPHVAGSWRGVLGYVFEVTEAAGRIEHAAQSDTGDVLSYRVAWGPLSADPS